MVPKQVLLNGVRQVDDDHPESPHFDFQEVCASVATGDRVVCHIAGDDDDLPQEGQHVVLSPLLLELRLYQSQLKLSREIFRNGSFADLRDVCSGVPHHVEA